jgi:hypothetical protein
VPYFSKALVEGAVGDGRAAALALAASHVQRAVHVDEAMGAGLFVQVVDVLGAEEEAARAICAGLG